MEVQSVLEKQFAPLKTILFGFTVLLVIVAMQAGYENLCCLRCIQPRDTNFGTNCVCRVPKSKLESVSTVISSAWCYYVQCTAVSSVDLLFLYLLQGKVVECVHCGCRGCSG